MHIDGASEAGENGVGGRFVNALRVFLQTHLQEVKASVLRVFDQVTEARDEKAVAQTIRKFLAEINHPGGRRVWAEGVKRLAIEAAVRAEIGDGPCERDPGGSVGRVRVRFVRPIGELVGKAVMLALLDEI